MVAKGSSLFQMKRLIKSVLGRFFKRIFLKTSFAHNVNIILMYHRVRDTIPSKLEDPALSVTSVTLKMHMKQVSRSFDIVPLSTLLAFPRNDRGMCAVTFDDGWLDNYEIAFPILKKHNIPATVFVPTDLVGKTDAFWFDGITNLSEAAASMNQERLFLDHFAKVVPAWQASELTRESVSTLVSFMKQLPADTLEDMIHKGYEVLGIEPHVSRSIINWDEISEMNKGNIEFGSHGCRHYVLPALNSLLKKREILCSLDALEERGLADHPVFSYPNGDWDEESISYLRQNRYEGSVATRVGYNNSRTNRYLLNRIGLHESMSNTPSMLWFQVLRAVLAGQGCTVDV
jgi:peptidoglycan/xylan/chitin deacetylase (PgdA/CDA1 family)